MYIKQHILASFLLAGILFPFTGLLPSLLVFFSGFLFDIDHYMYDVLVHKRYSILKSYQEKMKIAKGLIPRPPQELHIFHVIEWYLLLGISSLFFSQLRFIFLGLVLHYILDFIDGCKKKTLHLRAFSAIQFFFFKKRSLKTS